MTPPKEKLVKIVKCLFIRSELPKSPYRSP
nr:hypothetical protein JOCKYQNQ_JOCKYQNQ_CDS_0013 [Autographiviridae sp.]